jgi:hypothetical protein
MLRYVLDVRRHSIRMALYAFFEGEPALRMDARHIHSHEETEVCSQFQIWRQCYALNPKEREEVVACRNDPWPPRLADLLQASGFSIRWIDDADNLRLGVQHLDFLQERRARMRGALMAHWPADAKAYDWEWVALQALYNLLRHRLMELEGSLASYGHLPCPGHVAPICPACDRDLYPNEQLEFDYDDVATAD